MSQELLASIVVPNKCYTARVAWPWNSLKNNETIPVACLLSECNREFLTLKTTSSPCSNIKSKKKKGGREHVIVSLYQGKSYITRTLIQITNTINGIQLS